MNELPSIQFERNERYLVCRPVCPTGLRSSARAKEFTVGRYQRAFLPGTNIGAGEIPAFLFGLVLDNFRFQDLRLRWLRKGSICAAFFLSRLWLRRCRLHGRGSVEGCVTVIDAVKAFPSMEDLRSNLFFQRIPAFYRYEGLTAEYQGKHFALPAEIGHFAVDVLILDQAPDIPVNHPVKLGDQDDIIAEFSMLRKEGEPFVPACLLPVPGIKQELTLIDHNEHGAFRDVLFSVPVQLELNEIVRGHLVVGAIGEIGSFVPA